jgi:hypothetical protein
MIFAYMFAFVISTVRFYDHVTLFPSENSKTASEEMVPALIVTFIRGTGHVLTLICFLLGARRFLLMLSETYPLLEGLKSVINRHGELVVFACCNFVLAVLYYRIRYDSQGTFKPSWTDNLG